MAELPLSFLITFGLLFAAEKARDRLRWSPFTAALVYIVPAMMLKPIIIIVGMLLVSGMVTWSRVGIEASIGFAWHWGAQYMFTVALLALLSRYEDTIAMWMVIFIGGFVVLECIF